MPSRTLLNEDGTDAVVSETPHLSLQMGLPLQRRVSHCDAEIEPDEHEAIQGAKER
jgi:hypothetical protein